MAKCESCGEKIIWGKTKNDKWMPINFDSLTEADIRYLQTVDASKHPILFRYGEHVSHYATCPDANKFRKDKQNG